MTTATKRQNMIDALLQDDVRTIAEDLKHNDASYLMFLLEERKPYSLWTDAEITESFNILEQL
jgi:mevalonate pyrophosphate decarboxylase